MDLKISLLNLIFAMIYILHKILVLIKYYVTYLKDKIFEFFQSIIDFYFFNKNIFFIIYNDGISNVWRRKNN